MLMWSEMSLPVVSIMWILRDKVVLVRFGGEGRNGARESACSVESRRMKARNGKNDSITANMIQSGFYVQEGQVGM